MQKLFTYLLFVWMIGLSISVYGYFDSVDRVRFHGFDGEGSFIEGPAHAGAAFGYVLGILPATIITQPQRFGNYDQASDSLGVAILSGFSKPFSIFFGGFPYLLKKGFWDFPKWVIFGNDKSKDYYYEYKPTPLSEVKTDPRLLQEEKKHADLNMKENVGKPALVEVFGLHKEMSPISTPELKTLKEIKSKDSGEITLQPIPSSTIIDASAGNISGGYSIDTGKTEDNTQKWESSGLPDWVKKQVSQ